MLLEMEFGHSSKLHYIASSTKWKHEAGYMTFDKVLVMALGSSLAKVDFARVLVDMRLVLHFHGQLEYVVSW